MYYEEKIQSQFIENFGFPLWPDYDMEQKSHGVVLTSVLPSRYFKSLIEDDKDVSKNLTHKDPNDDFRRLFKGDKVVGIRFCVKINSFDFP